MRRGGKNPLTGTMSTSADLVCSSPGEMTPAEAMEGAVNLGDRVRIRPAGVSVFTIVDVDDEGRFVLESVDGIPAGYRFPMREQDLIPE
ncbi:hypothetical protein RDE2_53130 (plasmid) [Rhodococcus sp. RDE2]|nr:hypothetical protein RDE2_53130 [Rhodococcus sp. RDE2]